MKILVVEDTLRHQESAKKTLAGHDVTILPGFEEAMKLLQVCHNKDLCTRLLHDAGFPDRLSPGDPRYAAYFAAREKAERQSVIPLEFDVLLSDLLMPQIPYQLPSRLRNPQQNEPYGYTIMLLAVLRGIKYIAVVSDVSHHESAMAAALDLLGPMGYPSTGPMTPQFVINGSKVMIVHAPLIEAMDFAKDWGRVLADLIGE